MQDFAQFMAGATVTHTSLEARPDKGQTWQFADGRQGIVAAVDVSGATVYVGPESFRVPRGDWAVVFGAASLVLPPVAAPAPATTPTIDGRGFVHETASGSVASPDGPPSSALPSTIDVPSPAPPEPHRSRRDRKR